MDFRFQQLVCLMVLGGASVYGLKDFQKKIPNGDIVPHPCKPNYHWGGVGHQDDAGGGARNPFGVDFNNNNRDWAAVCHMDSDQDGLTNGQELGDPNCAWSVGGTPAISTGLSHPGVCEPMNSTFCAARNNWVDCTIQTLDCPAIYEPETRNITFRFPETAVPAKETTLICMHFDLPHGEDYHVIASEPVIDNSHVMHHIVIFGCEKPAPTNDVPTECGGVFGDCTTFFGVWSLGLPGQCSHSDVGIRIGSTSIRSVMLQFHWNNPSLVSDYRDSSGMTLYYTPKLRPYNAYQLLLGQLLLAIPPQTNSYDVSGTCTPHCSSIMLPDPIHVVDIFNHMHYMGRAAVTEHYRDGQRLPDIAKETYNYDSPRVFMYETPLEIRPGDELKLTCTYKSTKDTFTHFGEATSDEMCLSFLTYYVTNKHDVNRFPFCAQYGDTDICDATSNLFDDNCDYAKFLNFSHPETKTILERVASNCVPVSECDDVCADVIHDIKKHPCLKKEMADFIKGSLQMTIDGGKFVNTIHVCEHEETKHQLRMLQGISGASALASSILLTLLILYIAA